MSSLGETQLNLLSPKSDLKPEDLLGKAVTVTVQLRDDAKRHFNGFVTRFGAGRHQGRYFAYQATVNPWLWFLTRTSDCRIFQDLTVPDIVKKVFEDHGIAKFEFKTFRTYRKWVYCVQYRESDYNFVARLLEHEGIYWYFEHGDGQHKLVLVDSQSAHDAAKSCESLPFVEQGADTGPDTDCVSDWRFSQEVRTGKVALTSYDFERPSTDLKVDAKKERKYTMSDYEVFDFDGDYIQKSRRQAIGRRPHGRAADAVPGAARRVERARHRSRPAAQAHQAPARRPERAVPDHVAASQRARRCLRVRQRGGRLPLRLLGDSRGAAVPADAAHAEAVRAGPADGGRRRARPARRSSPTSTAA